MGLVDKNLFYVRPLVPFTLGETITLSDDSGCMIFPELMDRFMHKIVWAHPTMLADGIPRG
jgi:hypothetical protein